MTTPHTLPKPGEVDGAAVADGPGVAFFDFDGTLIVGDSLAPFIAAIVGRRRAWLAMLGAARVVASRGARGRSPGSDVRTAIKRALLHSTLAGVSIEEARAAAERIVPWVRWRAPMLDILHRHRREGRRIVVATGSLDIYMRVLLRDLPVDDLIATRVEVRDGVLTGHLDDGNCVRGIKAERVSAYLRDHGPFAGSWGYGNRPNDLAMLSLLDHGVVV